MSVLPSSLWADLIGLPFARGARGPDAFDCYGLLLEIYRRRGIELQPKPTPEAGEEMERMITLALGVEWRRIDGPISGCALLFRDEGLIRHVGVYIGHDNFIHASQSRGQVSVERLHAVRSYLPLIGAYQPITEPA